MKTAAAVAIALVAGVVIGYCARTPDRAIDELKVSADSLRQANDRIVAETRAIVALATRRADSLERVKGKVRTVIQKDSATTDSLQVALQVAASRDDSLRVYVPLVGSVTAERDSLRAVSRLDSLTIAALRHSQAELEVTVDDLQGAIATLAHRIAKLPSRPPKLVRYTLEGAKLLLVFAAGYQAGRS